MMLARTAVPELAEGARQLTPSHGVARAEPTRLLARARRGTRGPGGRSAAQATPYPAVRRPRDRTPVALQVERPAARQRSSVGIAVSTSPPSFCEQCRVGHAALRRLFVKAISGATPCPGTQKSSPGVDSRMARAAPYKSRASNALRMPVRRRPACSRQQAQACREPASSQWFRAGAPTHKKNRAEPTQNSLISVGFACARARPGRFPFHAPVDTASLPAKVSDRATRKIEVQLPSAMSP